jgi:hypothetical protein
MKDLHAKFLQALELQQEQIQAVQESKAADGKAKGEATKKLFDESTRNFRGKTRSRSRKISPTHANERSLDALGVTFGL